MRIPDISIAGGSINIYSLILKGTGKLTANAARQINITNSSNRSTLLSNITMDNAGGKIYFNDVAQPSDSKDNIKLETIENTMPVIKVLQ